MLFLALVRTVGEYFRLRATRGAKPGLSAFAPYVTGLGLGIVGTSAAVVLHSGRRFRAVVLAVLVTTLALQLNEVLVIR